MKLNSDPSARLLARADHCVKCGLCLPHCPTYTLTLDENESPRGRIALLQGLASGALETDERLAGHLDHCLACRACESVCPSGVQYGRILDDGRALLAERRPLRGTARRLHDLALGLVTHRRRRRALARLLRLYQRSGLRRAVRATGLLRLLDLGAGGRRPGHRPSDWEAQLPPVPAPPRWQARYPAQGERRATVALFTGCVGEALDGPTLNAAVRVLTRLGYEVLVPPAQTCCGALHQHGGDPHTARRLARDNLAAFADEQITAVVSCASGCGAQLAEYGALDWDDAAERDRAEALAGRVVDIGAFLADRDWPVTPAPLAARALVHEPCTLRNVLHAEAAAYRLLARIPGLDVEPLAGNALCCGAAGSYMLTEPEMARALRAPKLDAVEAGGPDLLVTSNIGCALHLAAGLRERGRPAPEVVHPIVLLDRQLQDVRGEVPIPGAER